MSSTPWPALPLADWRPTLDTLHMYAQIVGKIRLALSPEEPEWAHVALYVGPRGLTTGPIPIDTRTFEIDFDFIAHKVDIAVSDGHTGSIALEPRSVAEFYRKLMADLKILGIDVHINTMPQEVADPIPFDQDETHKSYDSDAAHRFAQALSLIDAAMQAHRAPFRGRHSRVQFFFGTFDIAYARFSGKPATPPNESVIMRGAMDRQEICAGFWPGDDRFPEPAFWCYAYPKPEGAEDLVVSPRAAKWDTTMGEFILKYEDIRNRENPREALREFFESTFDGLSRLAEWPEEQTV